MKKIISVEVLLMALGLMVFSASPSSSAGDPDFKITIKEHHFEPQELMIPPNKKIKLLVDNQDPSAEEFESYDLNREKIILGNKQAAIFLGPLKPGTYKYFGEFHQKTAQGLITVKE